MRLRIKAMLIAASASATIAGCQPPREITQVTPPGLTIPRVPANPQGEPPQAIGEQTSAAPTTKQGRVESRAFNSPPTPIGQPIKTASGLVYETLQEGKGVTVKAGDRVTIHYTGTLTDGTKFDSSRDKGSPLPVVLGSRPPQVIAGWEEGVAGMKVGERRKLTIPPELGYGPQAQRGIPANSTLVFDVELMTVESK